MKVQYAMFAKLSHHIINFVGSFWALITAAVLIWHSDDTLITKISFVLIIFIQHSQNKDTTAIQRKLDELVRAVEKADNNVVGIEKE